MIMQFEFIGLFGSQTLNVPSKAGSRVGVALCARGPAAGTSEGSLLSKEAHSSAHARVCTWIIHTMLTYLKMLMAIGV